MKQFFDTLGFYGLLMLLAFLLLVAPQYVEARGLPVSQFAPMSGMVAIDGVELEARVAFSAGVGCPAVANVVIGESHFFLCLSFVDSYLNGFFINGDQMYEFVGSLTFIEGNRFSWEGDIFYYPHVERNADGFIASVGRDRVVTGEFAFYG